MPNDKPDSAILNNDRKENHSTDLRSPTSVKEKDKTKQAKATGGIKTSNETEDAQDSLRKKISDICSQIVTCQQGQNLNDIGKLPAIADLCETLKQLSSHYGIQFDDANVEAKADFITLLKMIKKSRRQNMFEKALLHLHAYEQYCHGTDDELSEANISFAQFIITRLLQGDEASLKHAYDFLEKAKKTNDEILELKALFHLSDTHLRLFNVQQGIQFSDKVLQLSKKICHVKMEMISKIQRALAYLVLGEYQNSYNMFMECLVYIQTDYSDKNLESSVLNNICYTALNLTQNCDVNKALKLKKNALICIQRCLVIAESIGSPERVAIAHLNLGLVHMECYEDYDNAVKHFHEGLKIGEELKSARLVHQGCCCMGRLHEAKRETEIAKDYYTKALKAGDPPCTHWGEAENLRFSPDYLLALQHIGEKKWKDAARWLERVSQRCKRQGKSVKDSLLKISFNDKLKKPYQYLQYAYLKMEAKKDALVIGEEGRARDFYDKLVDKNVSVAETTYSPEELLKIPKIHNTAVLFLSQLTAVGRVYCWFIESDGRIIDVFWVSQDAWKPLNTKLCGTMYELAIHWRNSEISVEYRGVETETFDVDGIVDSSLKYLQSTSEQTEFSVENAPKKDVFDPIPCSKYLSSPFWGKERGQIITENESNILSKTAKRTEKCSRSPIEEISEITNEISELFLKPIEHHIEEMVKESTKGKPSLLIIPQEDTFNIPYAALRLKNGKHLCHQVTLLEAFSFHSFIHSTTRTEYTNENDDRMEESLIVGNPTNDLPKLPFAQQEAEMIAQLLGVTALTKHLATRSEVVSHLSSAPIIHFACHGSNDGRCLFLATEKGRVTDATEKSCCLTVDDVSQLNVDADMVVLSACHSARGKISIEGVLGLARAFLMAGAKSVITALWAIPDNATMTFMQKFYKNLREMRVGDALSTTMCQMQEEELFKHVVQWGSFKALGANVKVSLPK